MASVTLKKINKVYEGKDAFHALHDVDLDINDGEFVVFVGPSGCGKSTLLRVIAGLEDITGGDLLIGDERVNDKTPKERGIGMVFQSYALYPHMSVRENMEFGLKLAKHDKADIDKRVLEAARGLQLDQLLDRKPKELSGGQRQRVAIGRAIVREPQVFLFDEPLSNLDAALRVKMRIQIAQLHSELKNTMIYVTHDQVEAMTLANKIVVLSAGRVEQVGAPLHLYHHPANKFVAGFIGSPKMNFLTVDCTGTDNGIHIQFEGVSASVPRAGSPALKGQTLSLGVRPEHLTLDGTGDFFIESTVVVVEHLGDQAMLYLEREGEDGPLVVVVDGEQAPGRGDTIKIGVPNDRIHLFDTADQALPMLTSVEGAA